MTTSLTKYKLIFFTPPSHLSPCKSAIFAAGAGRFPGPGGYTDVCFVTRGQGQFKPGMSAEPHIGTPGQLEELEECKVETMCLGREAIGKAVEALKRVHPYEEVVYEVYKLEDM